MMSARTVTRRSRFGGGGDTCGDGGGGAADGGWTAEVDLGTDWQAAVLAGGRSFTAYPPGRLRR
jgi:hypothetical protein